MLLMQLNAPFAAWGPIDRPRPLSDVDPESLMRLAQSLIPEMANIYVRPLIFSASCPRRSHQLYCRHCRLRILVMASPHPSYTSSKSVSRSRSSQNDLAAMASLMLQSPAPSGRGAASEPGPPRRPTTHLHSSRPPLGPSALRNVSCPAVPQGSAQKSGGSSSVSSTRRAV